MSLFDTGDGTAIQFCYLSRSIFIPSQMNLFGCSGNHICTACLFGHTERTIFTLLQAIMHYGIFILNIYGIQAFLLRIFKIDFTLYEAIMHYGIFILNIYGIQTFLLRIFKMDFTLLQAIMHYGMCRSITD